MDADLTLGQFMDDVAWSRRYTTYPVLEHGHPIGLLAFRSVASVPREEWNTSRVREAMVPFHEVPLLTEAEPAIDALAELSRSDVNRGLVVDDDHLAGFLSITDLARALEVGRPSPPPTGRTPDQAPWSATPRVRYPSQRARRDNGSRGASVIGAHTDREFCQQIPLMR